jgi:hypothetical protein
MRGWCAGFPAEVNPNKPFGEWDDRAASRQHAFRRHGLAETCWKGRRHHSHEAFGRRRLVYRDSKNSTTFDRISKLCLHHGFLRHTSIGRSVSAKPPIATLRARSPRAGYLSHQWSFEHFLKRLTAELREISGPRAGERPAVRCFGGPSALPTLP